MMSLGRKNERFNVKFFSVSLSVTTEFVSLYDEESGRTLEVLLMSSDRKSERFNVKKKNFTLNRSFFLPNDIISSTPSVLLDSSSWRDTNSVVTVRQSKKTNLAIESRQVNQVLAYRVREHNKKTPPEIRATKKNKNWASENQRIPRWGRVQMTRAERTRTIECVLAESSRWLLH